MRILIAEDDQVLADGLLRSLRAGGYAVDQVASGTEADAALAASIFHFGTYTVDDLKEFLDKRGIVVRRTQ